MKDLTKLTVSIIIDILGYASYVVPVLGEISDIVWAIVEGWWIKYAYKSKKLAILGFAEEILPFTDFLPMCTIAHWRSMRK